MRPKVKIIKVGRWFALKVWAKDVFMTPTYLFKPFVREVGICFLGFIGYFCKMFIAFGYALTGRMEVFELDSKDTDGQ